MSTILTLAWLIIFKLYILYDQDLLKFSLIFKALDALVAELSASLEDDMKELEIEEKKFLKQ